MKRTVQFPIGSDSIIRITRYSGTGRVKVHLLTKSSLTGRPDIIRFSCSVGDLSDNVQTKLNEFGSGPVFKRKRKYEHYHTQAWSDLAIFIDRFTVLDVTEVLKR